MSEPKHPEGVSVQEALAQPCPNLGGALQWVSWLRAVGWRVDAQPEVIVARVYHPTTDEHVADVTCRPAGPADHGMVVF